MLVIRKNGVEFKFVVQNITLSSFLIPWPPITCTMHWTIYSHVLTLNAQVNTRVVI